jgi:hypothetical protein
MVVEDGVEAKVKEVNATKRAARHTALKGVGIGSPPGWLGRNDSH